MTGSDFPVPLTGIVHVGNRITVHRPIGAGETLDFTTHAENLTPRRRRQQLDVVLTGSVGGEEVWRGVSTYLSRAQRGGAGRREAASGPTAGRLGLLAGRAPRRLDYARVSGDHNPITSRIGARLLLPPDRARHVEQGRCLAALERPEAYTVDVASKPPCPAHHGDVQRHAGLGVRPARRPHRPPAPGGHDPLTRPPAAGPASAELDVPR
jgi:hypothetical protein